MDFFNDILGLSEQQFMGFLLAFLRVSALVTVAPIFGSQSVPVRVKVFLSLFLTIVILPALRTEQNLSDLTLPLLLPMAAKEILVGLFLGFCAKLVFEAFQFGGRIISNQMGLGVAELIDPESGSQVSVIGNLFSLVAIVLFLNLNGHHLIISALYKSFEIAPLTNHQWLRSAAKVKMLTMFNDIFRIGVKLAAPAMVTIFLLEISMAIMARIVPQMNIFFIGMPVKLGAGMFVIIISLPIFYTFFEFVLSGWKQDLNQILGYL